MNTFPRRSHDPRSLSLAAAAELLGVPAPSGAEELALRGIAPLSVANSDQLGFLADARYRDDLSDSAAAALLVSEAALGQVEDDSRPRLVVADAHRALRVLLEAFHPEEAEEPAIHPTAVLGRGVRLGEEVSIGPYAVLEAGVQLGDRVRIGAHVVLGAGSRVGDDSILYPHAVLYPGVEVGRRAFLHAGVRVGADGFGYAFEDGAHRKVPQVGRCTIEDDVELGANSTIDRGSIGHTRVAAGAKLDNLVQVGHNAVIGPLSVLAAQVGLAGSSTVGTGVRIGGQAGIAGHLSIGDGSQIAAQAGVIGDVAAGETVMGFPAQQRSAFLRMVASQRRVPEMKRRLDELEKRLAELEARSGPHSSGSPGR